MLISFPINVSSKVPLLDSTIALLTYRVIDRALGAEVSPRSLRQWTEYWILTSRWHTTPPRAIPHRMEGRRGRRTSVTTKKRSIPSNSSRTSLEKGGNGVTPDILVYTILRSKLKSRETGRLTIDPRLGCEAEPRHTAGTPKGRLPGPHTA